MSIRPEHRKTFPKARLPETLLMFMRLHGGEHAAVDAAFTYGPLADYFELPQEHRTLSRSDYFTKDPKPGHAWDMEVQAAAKELQNDAYVVRTAVSGKSIIWRLTPSGMDRADFWLKRMTEKTAALKAVTVDTQLVPANPGDRLQSAG